jgi:hypothetical protein
MEQRVGRVDRIGQSRTVHAVTLVGNGTGEDAAAARFSSRADRVDASLRGLAVSTTDLRTDAETEAARVTAARALAARGVEPRDTRPLLSVVTRRRSQPVRLWIWRVAFESDDGRRIWEWVFGTQAACEPLPDARRQVRAPLAASSAVIEVVDREAQARLSRLARELGPALALLEQRERDIAAVMRQQHARLAAALLQPSLFDHRAARAAAAQTALLDDAMKESALRLRSLAAAAQVRASPPALAFAVILQ